MNLLSLYVGSASLNEKSNKMINVKILLLSFNSVLCLLFGRFLNRIVNTAVIFDIRNGPNIT